MKLNRKLIFEAPTLPGGIIFIAVIDPTRSENKIIADAEATGVFRFKGSEHTDEAPHPMRFAAERFDLTWLLADVKKQRPFTAAEMRAMGEYAAPQQRIDQRLREREEQLNATPNWTPVMRIPAASWCDGPHPTGMACSYCGPIQEDHILHKAAHGT